MRTRTVPILPTRLALALGLVALCAGTAHAGTCSGDAVEAKIPFAFRAGTADLLAGNYTTAVAFAEMVVKVHDVKSGRNFVVPFEPTLSKDPHPTSDARLVFDKTPDGKLLLSEVWFPGVEGVLVGSARTKHEHETISVKTKW
jgi:hypothetical protein